MNQNLLLKLFLVSLTFILGACGPEQSETVSLPAATSEPMVKIESTDMPAEDSTETSVPLEESSPSIASTATSEATALPTKTAEPSPTPEPTNTLQPTEPPSLLERLGFIQGEPDLNILAERLLTIEDMPAGWSGSAAVIKENDKDTYDPYCMEGLPARSVGKVSVDFGGGGILSDSITAYGSVEDSIKYFSEYKEAANSCPQWTDDEGREIILSPLSFPAYGDESFAVRLNMGVLIADGVQVRVGDVLVGILQMGTEIDTEMQQTAVETALAKLNH